ncbi:Ras-related protein Rab-5B [Tritrichomonas foetus]|uniref:Ras-related protein Rab-5B n=1 Tax=Tritrichomonas foetus TaxID=1144522 RepID=A0A1J4K2N7_9EUKA|nr:Ras-related protein Rab-5B [Tritrichomonas foetus]|eukprot:OHT04012.1 Ras-related protein Rab-5B [Tritrichomonas foetus]
MNIRLQNRVVFCGDSSVGKTSILQRIKGVQFEEHVRQTKIASYYAYHYQNESPEDGEDDFDINFWDVGGDPKLRQLAQVYFQNIEIAVVVFDLTDRPSYDSLRDWVKMLKKESPSASFFLVANKNDKSQEKVVSDSELSRHRLKLFQVSAKTGEGIDDLVKSIGEECIKICHEKKIQHQQEIQRQNGSEPENKEEDENSNNCCTIM